MDLMEMIRNRRSVRTYRKGEIEEETLRKVLEAGLLAPSGRNRQPWELIVVRADPETAVRVPGRGSCQDACQCGSGCCGDGGFG